MKMIVKLFALFTLLTMPALGQGVPSQWNYSWQGNNAQALYPGQVSIPQLGTSPCLGVTAGLLGPGSCAGGTTTTILLTKYGYKPDGSTDNTSAVNQAIAAAAAAGGNTTIVAPIGTGLVGTTMPIINNNVWFACEGAQGTCTFKGTADAGLFQWGNASVHPVLGGIYGMTLDGNGDDAQTLLLDPNADQLWLVNDVLGPNLTQLALIGTSTTVSSGFVMINVSGGVKNSNSSLIHLRAGNGLFMWNCNIFNTAAIGGSSANRAVVEDEFSWDEVDIEDSFLYLFHYGIVSDVQNGSVFGDIQVSDDYFDQSGTAFRFASEAGGINAGITIHNTEMTGKNGDCFVTTGPGGLYNVALNLDDIRECQNNGINIQNAARMLNITNNKVYEVNVSNGNFAAYTMATGSTDVTLADNQFGIDASDYIGAGVPITGAVMLGTCAHCIVTSNRANGSSSSWAVGSFTSDSLVKDNPDLPSSTAGVTVTASPFTHTAGARPETDCISGGTVSSITQNSVGLQLTSGCFDLSPNEALTVTYSAAPTFIATVH